jgi:uncharacterized membrane protein
MAREKKSEDAAIFIPAGLFLGFGLGFIFDNIPAGIFGGLGLGFFLYAIVKNLKK